MAQCFKCGGLLAERIYRNTLCESCGADAKVCLNCTFYEPGAHWDCRETIPEAVREKDRANFCDYFVASNRTVETKENDQSSARDAFSSLFGDE